MKKVIAFALVLILALSLSATAWADFDLSGLSYDELVALKDQINLAIWNSEEWQEVEVPYGIWEVGADIPAGHWTITAGDGCSTFFYFGGQPNAAGTELEGWDQYWWLKSKAHRSYKAASDIDSIDLKLSDGDFIRIEEGSVIFTPYAGKASLGFK